MLKPEGRVILLVFLRFPASLKDPAELDLPAKADVPRNQMELALDLIKKFEGPFKPDAYKDTYAARLRSIIAAKAKGKTVHIPEEEEPRATEVADIMAKLKESLSATRH
jgi:DNA end-binding protein Ku